MLKITFQEQKFWKLKTEKKMLKAMKVCSYCTIIQDKITPAICVLTLKSLYCLDIYSADVNWAITTAAGIGGINGVDGRGSCSEGTDILL